MQTARLHRKTSDSYPNHFFSQIKKWEKKNPVSVLSISCHLIECKTHHIAEVLKYPASKSTFCRSDGRSGYSSSNTATGEPCRNWALCSQQFLINCSRTLHSSHRWLVCLKCLSRTCIIEKSEAEVIVLPGFILHHRLRLQHSVELGPLSMLKL